MPPSSSDDATLVAEHGRDLSAGSVFAGRYVVEGPLGQGGMGAVYAVLDRELGERVALKVLSAVGDVSPEVLERFRREVRVARRVTHRNVARTFDIGEHAGLRFLTMELVDGKSLADRLDQRSALPPAEVIEIGTQICDGLSAVHDAGMIHRDLKPSNVLLETTGRVVLTDFGIARPTSANDRVTREPGQLVGTPHYMAPEQVTGETLTARTDLYALGLMLYEMTTGRLPFVRDSAIATAMARLGEEPPKLPERVPEGLAAAIMACLERTAATRPVDAAAVRALLGGQDHEHRREPTSSGPGSGPGPGPAPASNVTEPSIPEPATSTAGAVPSVDVGERSLAVLPMRYRGPADDSYVAEAITEQLIDLLSMTRGLRVPAAGATEPFAERRDPRAVREALGVDAVVDGTVQRSGSRLRVSVRLLDATTGYQQWSERVEGELTDVFELQDRIATRVAETLRLRVETAHFEVSAPPEALELYMRARVSMRDFRIGGIEGAPALLARCLELAPNLAPALASYAMACARMWFLHGEDPWAARCEDAVVRALQHGPHLPDTHLAAARMYGQQGRFGEAARALQKVLELAPTHAAGHTHLGLLQCEAGRGESGVRHIEMGLELAPSSGYLPLITAVRHLLLNDETERAERIAQRMLTEEPASELPLLGLRLRHAMWNRDREAIARHRDAVRAGGRPFHQVLLSTAAFALGEIDLETLMKKAETFVPESASRRYQSLLGQLLIEGLLAGGRPQEALPVLEEIAEDVLVDVDWLEHCASMEQLVDEPRMLAVRNKVHARASAIWAVG